jgi:hypothetical protein
MSEGDVEIVRRANRKSAKYARPNNTAATTRNNITGARGRPIGVIAA